MMLNVFICENDPSYRKWAEQIINNFIISQDCQIDLVLSSPQPTDVLEHLRAHAVTSGLYLLDVDLGTDINGIELASEIRKRDVSATIVFVTTQSELAHLTFQYKVEAMDYILKSKHSEEVEQSVINCIQIAYERYLRGRAPEGKHFTIKTGDQILNVPLDQIVFLETHPTIRHKVILYKKNGKIEFRGSIQDLENLGTEFYHCHKSYVVNLSKVISFDKRARTAAMQNGAPVPVAVRKVTEFSKLLEANSANNIVS